MGRPKHPRLFFQLYNVEVSGVLGVYANLIVCFKIPLG